MPNPREIEHTTTEIMEVPIVSRLDPTGGAVEFQMTAHNVTSPTGSWTAGSWNGSWNSTTGKVTALSPIIGSGSFALTEGTLYKLWVRWTIGSENPTVLAGVIRAT